MPHPARRLKPRPPRLQPASRTALAPARRRRRPPRRRRRLARRLRLALTTAPSTGASTTATVGAIQATMVSPSRCPPDSPPIRQSRPRHRKPTAPRPPPPSRTHRRRSPARHDHPHPNQADTKARAQSRRQATTAAAARSTRSPPARRPQGHHRRGRRRPASRMSITQLKNGTAPHRRRTRAFGDRFAYYVQHIKPKARSQVVRSGMLDPHATGQARQHHLRRSTATAPPPTSSIDHPQRLTHPRPTALRAVQRIDTFGPLPDGDQRHLRQRASTTLRLPPAPVSNTARCTPRFHATPSTIEARWTAGTRHHIPQRRHLTYRRTTLVRLRARLVLPPRRFALLRPRAAPRTGITGEITNGVSTASASPPPTSSPQPPTPKPPPSSTPSTPPSSPTSPTPASSTSSPSP